MTRRFTIISSCEARRDVYQHAKEYEDKAVRLARSIRANGGADVPVVMWYGADRPPTDATRAALLALDCRLVEGVCRHPEAPVYNKKEALATAPVETEARVWFDTDIYVRGGLDAFDRLDCDVAATADTYAHHFLSHPEDVATWAAYGRHLGLPTGVVERAPKLRTAIDGERGCFNLTAGLIYMRNDSDLVAAYSANVERVFQSDLPRSKEYHDPIGLTLTVLQRNATWTILPEELNYVYALRHNIDAKIIHYQDNVLDNYPEIDWPVPECT